MALPESLMSHVGIAVADLNAAIQSWQVITGDRSPFIEDVPDQRVRVAIFSSKRADGERVAGRIELVAATSPDSPIAKFIERKGEGLHHVCIYVRDIEAKLAELKSAGMKLIDETPRVGAEGKRIAFVHPSGTSGVLIELEEIA